ncbi:response regulator receiver domain-containing protein [Tahibacter aquaticus]|uniref:Response regulator receiver domain-containing protein n=1 Tax=Tahibacter aquaticus TaxID=520092 RepID=A0A4R6YNL9_9GAMM|nr:response regulator [Tahibacter aquaticus]TDR39202.1 response regulator receiver domain-containing protein [Tahibacter aquaticus]
MYRVLIVDDEPNILTALRRNLSNIPPSMLDGERLELIPANSPEDALQLAVAENFDLVIADLRMPGISGVDLLAEIAARQPYVARILMSGYADLEAIITAVNQARIFRFIPKPWNDNDLRMAVVQALHYRAILLENQRLADLVRAQRGQLERQDAELRRLEMEHPGLTRLERDESGAIFIDEDDL